MGQVHQPGHLAEVILALAAFVPGPLDAKLDSLQPELAELVEVALHSGSVGVGARQYCVPIRGRSKSNFAGVAGGLFLHTPEVSSRWKPLRSGFPGNSPDPACDGCDSIIFTNARRRFNKSQAGTPPRVEARLSSGRRTCLLTDTRLHDLLAG